MIVKISPAMRLSYKRWIEPKLSKRQKRLFRELAADIGKRINVRLPNAHPHGRAVARTVQPLVGSLDGGTK